MRRAARAAIDVDTRRKRWAVARVLPLAGGPLLSGVAVAIVVASVLPAAFTVATGNLVGAVGSAARHSGTTGHVVVVLAIVSALFLAQQLIVPVIEVAKTQLGWTVTDRMFVKLIGAACDPVGIGHLEDPAVLDKLELAQGAGSANMGPGPAAEGLLGFLHRRLQGWAAIAVLARFSPWLALLLFAELSVSYRLYVRGLEAYASRWAANEETFRRTRYFRELGLDQQGAKEIRVFGLGPWVAARYRDLFTAAMTSLWSKRRHQAAGQLVPIVLDTAVLAVIFVALGHAALDGSITVGALTTYTGAALASMVLTVLGNDELQLAWGGQALLAAEDLFATVAPLVEVPSRDRIPLTTDALPARSIVFESVSFGYPGREPLFDGLELHIEAGRSLAIVGANGAGKTTLVKLLARLYEPTSGRILVDGIDLRDVDAHAWRRRVAAIFQDFNRYDAYTLADNIGLGCVENVDDRAGVIVAAERAGAASLADSLPKGWDSPMSRQYRDGAELSGGQWQRVALARALFATQGGAGVLVLDEPTSNLDVRGETELYDRFLDVTRGVTTVVISHRFSTVRRADRIVVLADGRVREDGTHQDLLAAGGFYAEMFRLQASRYDEPAPVDG
jgi:ABC-type multidrug transport system fused ATPase/permease subunit